MKRRPADPEGNSSSASPIPRDGRVGKEGRAVAVALTLGTAQERADSLDGEIGFGQLLPKPRESTGCHGKCVGEKPLILFP